MVQSKHGSIICQQAQRKKRQDRELSSVLKWIFSLCHQLFFVSPEIKNVCGFSVFLSAHLVESLRFPHCWSKAVFVALLTLA